MAGKVAPGQILNGCQLPVIHLRPGGGGFSCLTAGFLQNSATVLFSTLFSPTHYFLLSGHGYGVSWLIILLIWNAVYFLNSFPPSKL
jgi:hypothetical protein